MPQAGLLADQGADVFKVESSALPDGSRQSRMPGAIAPTFATGHRNKRSLGLDLRHPKGNQILLELVRQTDVILSNFISSRKIAGSSVLPCSTMPMGHDRPLDKKRKRTTKIYARNAWYVASWIDELSQGTPVALRVLGEPIVLWRADGRSVALEGHCLHRLAPLSRGRCEAGQLRC